MSEPIKPGDMVQIVRPTYCCGSDEKLGLVFRVERMEADVLRCNCGHVHPREVHVELPNGWWIELSRLKRIPPLFELDDVRQDEEITA